MPCKSEPSRRVVSARVQPPYTLNPKKRPNPKPLKEPFLYYGNLKLSSLRRTLNPKPLNPKPWETGALELHLPENTII